MQASAGPVLLLVCAVPLLGQYGSSAPWRPAPQAYRLRTNDAPQRRDPPQPGPSTPAEQYLFQSVNAERAAAGLPPLRWNAALANAAADHARRMYAAATLSHQLRGEAELGERAASAGAHFSRVAENVAVGENVLRMHDALMRSEHHRDNILDPAVNSVAVAVVPSSHGELWAVEDFAREVQQLSLEDQEQAVAARLRPTLPVAVTEEARLTCEKSTGYVGQRPAFVMRYTTSDLSLLPDALQAKLAENRFSGAAVGACAPERGSVFTSYNVAVVLYR